MAGMWASALVLVLVLQCSLAFQPPSGVINNVQCFPKASLCDVRASLRGDVTMSAEQSSVPRRDLVSGAVALATIVLAPQISSAHTLEETADAIKAARNALEPIAGYIADEKWDKCRTVLNNPPLGFTGTGTVKDQMDQASKLLPKSIQGAAKGLGQDVLTNVRLLDTFCYNNVFIDEGRQVLGVKIDKKTPLNYLKQSKASLDEYLELFP